MTRPTLPRWLLSSFACIFLLLAVGGIWLYQNERTRALAEAGEQLTAVGTLINRQIADWRNERIADGKTLAANQWLIQHVNEWLRDDKPATEAAIRAHLKSIRDNYHYHDAMLLDADGKPKLAFWGLVN